MKRLYIAILLIVISLFIGIFETYLTNKLIDNTINNINEINDFIDKNNMNEAINKIIETEKDFDKINQNYLHLLTLHDKFDEVGFNLTTMKIHLIKEDYNEYFSLKEKTKKQLLSLKTEKLPIIQNII